MTPLIGQIKTEVPLELIVRDVYTMHGNLDKASLAVEIARCEIDKFFPDDVS